MDLQLSGSTAIIFGGARGLGLAIAEAFLAEETRVVLVDRLPTVCETAAQLSNSRPGQAAGVVLDLTDAAAVETFASDCLTAHPEPLHLVLAAGIGSGKFGFPFWNLAPTDWPRVLEVNLQTAVNVLHAFAPALSQRRTGTVLLLSSVAGQIGSQTDPPYSAAKAAVINFGQCAAKDLAPYGVRVNTVCPGMVQTELNRAVWKAWADQQPPDQVRSYEDWAGEKVRKVVPLGRWQTPADIAAMAVFLASPRAGNVTGQTINVDGGFVMHW